MKEKELNKDFSRKDSLIKSYVITEDSETTSFGNKIIFTTVKDIDLIYYTNTKTFVDNLKNFDTRFIISYEFSRANTLVEESDTVKRIIKVKLPKLPKK